MRGAGSVDGQGPDVVALRGDAGGSGGGIGDRTPAVFVPRQVCITAATPAERPLGWRVIEDALLVPTESRGHYRDIGGAVFDRAGAPVVEAFLTRSWGQITRPPDISGIDRATADTVEEPHVYGGYCFDHFGHFLLESLARLWVTEEVGAMPVAWSAGDPPNRWQAQILDLVGVGSRHVFPRRPTVFRRLIVPDPGFRIQGEMHPRHMAFLARFDARPASERRGKLYISRSAIRNNSGERTLQRELSRRGWTVWHPQDHSVRDQLRTLTGAEVVAALEGSALHSMVLLRGATPPFVVLRKSSNVNFHGVATAKGIADLNLYGGFRLRDPKDKSLVAPRTWARRIDAAGTRAAALAGDPAGFARLKEEVEAEHDLASWDRRQKGRILARLRARLRREKLWKRFAAATSRLSARGDAA